MENDLYLTLVDDRVSLVADTVDRTEVDREPRSRRRVRRAGEDRRDDLQPRGNVVPDSLRRRRESGHLLAHVRNAEVSRRQWALGEQ